METCDLRTAHENFDSAFAADEPRAALGFAITDLLSVSYTHLTLPTKA